MGKTIKALLLAVLNATLILVALCLWLAWGAASTVRSVTAELGSQMAGLLPLRDEVAGLTSAVEALRVDLVAVQTGDAQTAEVVADLRERVAALDKRLTDAGSKIGRMADDPGLLMDRAINTASQAAVAGVAGLMACSLPKG